MWMDVSKIPTRDSNGQFHVVIEAPRGSRIKFKYDPALSAFVYSRTLVLGVAYPFDFGFIPGTQAADGDPLDAMVLQDEGTYPGIVIPCRAVAVIKLKQDRKHGAGRERNDRIIAVPAKAPRFEHLRSARDLPERWRKELEQFFIAATVFEPKNPTILRWGNARAAEKLVDDSGSSAG
jgi:inorganic pyrophosphatase